MTIAPGGPLAAPLRDLLIYAALYLAIEGVVWALGMGLSRALGRGRIHNASARPGQKIREIAYSALAALLIGSMIATGVETRLWRPSLHHGPFAFVGLLALVILLHDTWFYWGHRILHLRPFMWIHRVHHLAHHPSVLSASSVHPMEAFLDGIFLLLVGIVVPLDRALLASFMALMLTRTALSHLGREVFPARPDGTPLVRAFATVTHHDLHHQALATNFGFYFTWWDRLMGTEHRAYATRFAQNASGRRAGRTRSRLAA